ncbi:MAG: LD-carboxypeptidase, partial [Candidatus Binataceae bacterium]
MKLGFGARRDRSRQGKRQDVHSRRAPEYSNEQITVGEGENIIKPPALRPGDTVGVVAPAATVERAHLERGVSALTAMGYRVKVSARALERSGILAGDNATRAAELTAFFADPEVKA